MTEEDWLTHLEKHPGQKEEALKFADWLEENGKPAHAELIRLHCNPKTCTHPYIFDPYSDYSAGEHVPKGFEFYEPPLIENYGLNKEYVKRRFYTPHSNKLSRIMFGAKIRPEAAKHLTAALKEEIKDNFE